MTILILTSNNLSFKNYQSYYITNYLNKLRNKNIYYLNVYEYNINNKFQNKNIKEIKFNKYASEHQLDFSPIELYNEYIYYRFNKNKNVAGISVSVISNKTFLICIKLYLEVIYKICLDLNIKKIMCFDLILVEFMYGFFNNINNIEINSLEKKNIYSLQKLMDIYILNQINYDSKINYLDHVIYFNQNYKNYFNKFYFNDQHMLEFYRNNCLNCELFNYKYKINDNLVINKHNIFNIINNGFYEKLNDIKKQLLNQKVQPFNTTQSNEEYTFQIGIDFVSLINNNCFNYLLKNECTQNDYDNYLDNDLNNIISSSMIYTNLVQKIINLFFDKLIYFFNNNYIINKDVKLNFIFVNKCIFNFQNLNKDNYLENINTKSQRLKNIKDKIKLGFKKINNNFVESYKMNLETYKLNLNLYTNINKVYLYSNMLFNQYFTDSYNKIISEPDINNLVLQCFDYNSILNDIEDIKFNF